MRTFDGEGRGRKGGSILRVVSEDRTDGIVAISTWLTVHSSDRWKGSYKFIISSLAEPFIGQMHCCLHKGDVLLYPNSCCSNCANSLDEKCVDVDSVILIDEATFINQEGSSVFSPPSFGRCCHPEEEQIN